MSEFSEWPGELLDGGDVAVVGGDGGKEEEGESDGGRESDAGGEEEG